LVFCFLPWLRFGSVRVLSMCMLVVNDWIGKIFVEISFELLSSRQQSSKQFENICKSLIRY